MEDFKSLWSYQEDMNEVIEKLLYTRIELESVKMEAIQEMVKNKENVKNLLNLLQMAYKERDEAKNQLQMVLNKLTLSSSSSHFQPETPPPLLKPNSSITESNSNPQSQSQSQSHSHSHGSPVIHVESSSDFSSVNAAADSYNTVDPSGLVIENILKGKKLPEKGRLLQSVMDAGPLLQTLLVSGPLPRWRNPPPLQPFEIAPFFISNTPTTCSSSMLNFSADPSDSSCFIHNALVSGLNSPFGSQFPSAKRQRFS